MARATSTDRKRRALLLAAGSALLVPTAFAADKPIPVEVWKDPSCGCCKDWVAHLEANGFQVKVHDTGNNGVRAQLRIVRKYASCHTALVGGYALEGHVPAGEVLRLLKEKPQAVGLAVPGMPVGSPGMDGDLYGGRRDDFDVLLLARDGSAKVYRHYEGNKEARKA